MHHIRDIKEHVKTEITAKPCVLSYYYSM